MSRPQLKIKSADSASKPASVIGIMTGAKAAPLKPREPEDTTLKPHAIEFADLEPELREAIRVLRRLGFEGSDEQLLERARLEMAVLRGKGPSSKDKEGIFAKLFL